MGKYFIKRLLALIPILFFTSILVFCLVRTMPGGAALAYLRASNIAPTDEAVRNAEITLGLNKPILIQYLEWLRNAIHLDLGTSFYNHKEVLAEIARCMVYTVWLSGAAFIWLLVIGFILGVGAAKKPGGFMDHFSRLFSFLGASMPPFLLGFLLVLLFAIKLQVLPVYGAKKPESILLPSITLAIGYIADYSRILRNSLLENKEKRYVQFCRVRGIEEKNIMRTHVIRNSLIPVITNLGVSFGHMLAGSVIVENVFSWPGLGRLLLDAINGRDFPMIQGYVLVMAVIFVLINLLVDVICAFVNPQIRFERR